MDRASIKNAVKAHMAAASDQAAAVCALREAGTLTFSALEQGLFRYILFKYWLAAEDVARGGGKREENIEELARLSLDKMTKELPEQAAIETMSATCDGADSISTKQALLLMAVQQDFQVKLDGFSLAFADTVHELAGLIWDAYGSEDG